jgi:hypothetical protein
MTDAERLQILEMIEQGQINAAEGIKLLEALQTGETEGAEVEAPQDTTTAAPEMGPAPELGQAAETVQTPQPEPAPAAAEPRHVPSPEEFDPRIGRWSGWWQVPLWIGVVITILSGILMFVAWQNTHFSFWFGCTWLPFLLGVALLALAWASSKMRWLHVRIHQKPGERPEKIAISFPLPVGVIAWGLRTFKHKIPGSDKADFEQVAELLGKTSRSEPLYVQVDDDKDGERVEVYIG